MKNISNICAICFVLLSLLFVSCDDDYDPIGNNKPAPILKISSNFLAFPSNGGNLSVDITTNVEEIETSSTVSWISGSYNEEILTLTAIANAEDDIREALVNVATVTGSNEAQSSVRIIQGNKGSDKIFANMLRSDFDDDWKSLKSNGNWKVEDFAIRTDSPGDIQSIMTYRKEGSQTIRSATNKFKFSVDVKNSNNWAGVVFNAKDDKNYYYVGLNISPTSLFVVVNRVYNGVDSPHAMDPGIVLSEDRDSYLRCEIVSTTDKPHQFTVNIYELKTTGNPSLNTDVSVIQKLAYTRTFNDNLIMDGGYAGIWGKVGGGYFRRFVLTTN